MLVSLRLDFYFVLLSLCLVYDVFSLCGLPGNVLIAPHSKIDLQGSHGNVRLLCLAVRKSRNCQFIDSVGISHETSLLCVEVCWRSTIIVVFHW